MTRRRRQQARRKNRRRPGPAAFVLTIVVCAALGMRLGRQLSMAPLGASAPARPAAFSLVPRLAQPMNVLFMACDNTDEEERHGHVVIGMRGNTDTMIVARLDPGRDQVRLLSIPRDTRVPIPGHGVFKINAANPYGGPRLALQVVSSFLGTPVDKYVLINTHAVIQLVDALGGVKLFVPKDLNYDDQTGHLHIHLSKGWQHLNGQQAHDFLRFRHDDQGDIGRVQRQQSFLQAFFQQIMTPSNILKVPRILALAQKNVRTNLTPAELVRMATWGKDLTSKNVGLCMVPGQEAIIARGWYWQANASETSQIVHTFLNGEAAPAPRAVGTVRLALQDGVGDRRSLHALSRALRRSGYVHIEDDGQAPRQGRAITRIIAQRADVPGARAIAKVLGVGQVEVASTGNLDADFTIVMGRDWSNVLAFQAISH